MRGDRFELSQLGIGMDMRITADGVGAVML